MANSLLTISMITREALRVLENNLTFAKGVNRQYDDKYGQEGAKIGTTLNVRKPARYVGRTGAAISIENQTETSVPVVLNTQRGVDVQFTSSELKLSLDDFSERYIQPAMANIANGIDRDGLMQYLNIANAVGTPGTVPSALTTYLNAGAKLDYCSAPKDGMRSVVVDPLAQATIISQLSGLFNPTKTLSNQYETGNMGEAVGFKWSMDQNIPLFTVGPLGGTPVVNGAGQTGSSLVTNGWTAAAAPRLNQGDIFTIAGVYQVNAQSRQSTGQLQQFVVTAAVSSDGSGNATIPIYPAIITSGQFQTVTASPASSAAITVLGSANTVSPAHLAYHRDAFCLASTDLPLPGGVDMASRVSDPRTGLSVRMVRQYSITNDTFPCRLDVLYGWATLYPELACRIQG
jgi:hypothetical protein